MNVLVAYASKHGSTAEIADAIAETLRVTGIDADCLSAGSVDSVEGYDAVVLGSAVYTRRWRGEARHFLRRHGEALAERPFWVFSSGPVGPPAGDAPAWMEPSRTMGRVEELGARGHVVFGGRVPPDAHGVAARAMARNTPPEYRDRRDWDAIRDWASRIAADLRAEHRAA
jgi:menaquinone-dependent protoporphyrinogen oxidase